MGKLGAGAMLCALLLSLLVAGCGGDEEPASGGGASGDVIETGDLSKAEFTQQANAICKEGVKEIQAAFRSLGTQEDGNPQDSQTKLADAAVSAIETEIDEISALGAPAGDEEQVAAFLDALGEAQAEIETSAGKLENASAKVEKANKLADRYGIESCPFG